MFSTITAQPGWQMRNSTCGAGPSFDEVLAAGLATGLAAGLATVLATRREAGL
jgi:hypothetical protein